MALTRAQILSGDQSQGVVLPGQVQAVKQGIGILILPDGTINVDSTTVTGLMRLNNVAAYNAYVWPPADGAAGTFLKTDGAGNLSWITPSGFSVVTVSGVAPSPPDVGELWYDCTTGTLKVFQNCVTPNGWTDTAQPGLEVLASNTSAAPAFTGGTGTQADPYDCTVTTTGAGTTVFVVNTVTVVGLAPFQFVPIVDLNAVANGGRFSFTNNYADAGGNLTFQTVFTDAPASLPGTTFTAAIKVGYNSVYIDAIVNVILGLTTTAGSITGTTSVGSILTYTTGVASGGTAPYTYAWNWQRNGVDIVGATASTYTLVAADLGANITVALTATDAALTTATATTAPVGPVTTASFPAATWNPTPAGAMNSDNPGTSSGTWNGANGTTITATGCAEVSTDGVTYSASVVVNTGQTLFQRWKQTPACGGAATGTALTGTVSDGTYTNSYTVTIDRIPSPALADISDTGVVWNATVTKASAAAIAGLNSTAYVTYVGTSTGTSIQASTDNVTFTPLATSGTGFPVVNGQTLYIRQTVGATASTGYTAIIQVGDGTGTAGTYDEFIYTATTTATNPIPTTTYNPTPSTGPAASNTVATGIWNGTADTLTSTGCIELQVNAGAYSQGPTAVTTGDTVNFRWVSSPGCTGAANGTVITGTLVAASGGSNSYSLTVDTAASNFTFTDLTSQALSTAVTSASITLAGTNVSTYLTTTGGTLTSIQASINGGAFTAVPASGTTLEVPPGATIQVRGTTGASTSTGYTAILALGTQTTTWTATTTAAVASIQTPSITAPVNGATGVGSATGITLTGDTYTPLNGAGATQTSSLWEVYKANPTNPETSAITNVATGTLGAMYWSNTLYTTKANILANATPLLAGNSAPVSSYVYLITPTGATNGTPIWSANGTSGGASSWKVAYYDGAVFQDATGGGGYTWTADPTSFVWKPTVTGAFYQLGLDKDFYLFPAAGTSLPTAAPLSSNAALDSAPPLTSATTLTLTDATDLANMQVGDSVVEVGGGADASGTISAINSATAPYTLTLNPSSGTWNTGSTAKDTTRTVTPPAPTTDPPNATKYTAVTGSPFTVSSAPFTSYTVAQSALTTSTTYYARVQYATTNATSATSSFSAWSNFTTGTGWVPTMQPGKIVNFSANIAGTGTVQTSAVNFINFCTWYNNGLWAIGTDGKVYWNQSPGPGMNVEASYGTDNVAVAGSYNVGGGLLLVKSGGGATAVTGSIGAGVYTPVSSFPLSGYTGTVAYSGGCGGISTLLWVVTTTGELWVINNRAAIPSNATTTQAYGGTGAVSQNTWYKIPLTLPAGEKLKQIMGVSSSDTYPCQFVGLTESGNLYAWGTTGLNAGCPGIPTGGTTSSPTAFSIGSTFTKLMIGQGTGGGPGGLLAVNSDTSLWGSWDAGQLGPKTGDAAQTWGQLPLSPLTGWADGYLVYNSRTALLLNTSGISYRLQNTNWPNPVAMDATNLTTATKTWASLSTGSSPVSDAYYIPAGV